MSVTVLLTMSVSLMRFTLSKQKMGTTLTLTGQPLLQEPAGSYDIQGNYNGNVPLDATVDLRPGERIVFDVEANGFNVC